MKSESKRKNSVLNALSSILYTGVNGLLTIIVTRVVLVHYGSDYNGLNATSNQIVSILLVLESGITLASNVALFSPLAEGNEKVVSRIISTTRASFKKIGIAYLCIGFFVVLIYSRFIVSNIPYYEVLVILLVSLIPTAFNLIFAAKYSVLFQSAQHEYVVNAIKTISCVIGNMTVILVGSMSINRILLRILMLLNTVLSVILIVIIGKRKYKYLDMDFKPDYSLLPGTKDLMIQKFVGLVYSSAPMLIMSARIGTIAISVYGVYTSVTLLMKSIANAFMNSPRMSLGVLIAEKNLTRTKTIFREYEMVVFSSASIMTICYFSLIIPFAKLYTRGVTDANYIQSELAVLLGLVFFVECLHIPSGIFLNMAGLFKISKKIQTIAMIVLSVFLVISYYISTINAFVLAVLIAATFLAVMEICCVHFKEVMCNQSMDKKSLIDMLIIIILTGILSFFGFALNLECNSYLELLGKAILVFLAATASICCFFEIYDRPFIRKYYSITKSITKIFDKDRRM